MATAAVATDWRPRPPGRQYPGPSPARTYALSLTTRGTTISAQVSGVRVGTVSSHAYRYGPAGLGSLGYYPVRYLSFTVR